MEGNMPGASQQAALLAWCAAALSFMPVLTLPGKAARIIAAVAATGSAVFVLWLVLIRPMQAIDFEAVLLVNVWLVAATLLICFGTGGLVVQLWARARRVDPSLGWALMIGAALSALWVLFVVALAAYSRWSIQPPPV